MSAENIETIRSFQILRTTYDQVTDNRKERFNREFRDPIAQLFESIMTTLGKVGDTSELQDAIDANTQSISAIMDQLEENDPADLSTQLDTLQQSVDDLVSGVDDMMNSIASNTDTISTILDRLDTNDPADLSTQISNLQQTLNDLVSRVEALEEEPEDI